MNSLSNVAPPTAKNWQPQQQHHHHHRRCPIPAAALYVLLALFLVGLCVSTFFLVVIHNAFFFVLCLCASALIAAFLLWNSRNAAVFYFLDSLPDSDLSLAAHGQLVKITGVVSCGNISLETSYEKVFPCVYTSTLLYEDRDLCLMPSNVRDLCILWRQAYSERFSSDFYITELKSGVRTLVKAGPDSKVIPLMIESRLIQTSTNCRHLSSNFSKWLLERNISPDPRSLCLREGYIKEGSCVSVIGILQRNNDDLMIVEPPEIVSTGCLWSKLLLPVDFQGLIIGLPKTANSSTHTNTMDCP